ncbi:MAG: Mov34/MPN/PAD-1 family protein [Bacteroidales bacterium]|nr:Mov34/MPN/PAD-1 family protein [Bacteroidales bacterium]
MLKFAINYIHPTIPISIFSLPMGFFDNILAQKGRLQPPPLPQPRAELIDEKAPSPTAIIYRSELDYLSRCVLDYPNIETGGQLFGFWTNQGVPVVLYAIGPGRNANHENTFFNQDIPYLMQVGNELLSRYALQHIGEWHSHHQLGLARPSGHDANTMHRGMASAQMRHVLLCICNYRNGRSTVNPYTFHEDHPRDYADAQWQVIEMESPFRPIIDRELSDILIHPRTEQPAHGENREIGNKQPSKPEGKSIKIDEKSWLSRPGNIERLKQMVAHVKALWPEREAAVQANEEGLMQVNLGDGWLVIRFGTFFPRQRPIIIEEGQEKPWTDLPHWDIPVADTDILDTFRDWISLYSAQTKKNEE